MSNSERTLPDFESPPVIEVALGVQFDPPLALTSAHLGRIWEIYQRRFPKTQDQPPLPSVIETPDAKVSPGPSVQFVGVPPLPRCWFLNEAETELIQIQKDRFVRNWRKVQVGDVYPRYEQIRDGFRDDLDALVAFASRERLGEVRPTQCEATYVNHIRAGAVWQSHSEVQRVVALWRGNPKPGAGFLPEPEDVRFAVRYVITEDSGQFLGRLNVDLQPGFLTSDQSPILVLTLTARGRPDGSGLQGVLNFLNRGREWIVRGFTEITTEATQQQEWKRTK